MDSLAGLADQQLVREALGGRPDAYGELVRRYQARVYAIAYRLVGEQQEALDMTQDAFVRGYHALGSFDQTRPFGPWIGRIVTNLALNALDRRRVPTVSLSRADDGADDPAAEWQLPDSSAEPERVYLAGERQAALQQAIQALPPHYRAVIELRHGQELSYEAIGATLGLPLSDVKSYLFRARQLLRKQLKDQL